jgi:hypothetical protein
MGTLSSERVRRRTFVRSAATLGALSLGGCTARTRVEGLLGSTHLEPRAVEPVGETDGGETLVVPTPGTVTVIDLFSTLCASCPKQLDSLEGAFEAVGDRAVFVSVTARPLDSGRSREDLRAWWREHGGPWPVGVGDGTLLNQLRATTLPYTAIVDADGRVVWARSGVTTVGTLVSEVKAAASKR